METFPVVAHTLGADTVFFSNPTRPTYGMTGLPPSGRIARCELWESAGHYGTTEPIEPLMWVQCGQVASLAPDGDYLCEDCMLGWYCGACGVEMPEYGYPDRLCVRCLEN
jgi:hypothetical protein